ncbi:SDR family oxidoreductase [Demequina sp. TTPB684]|uniref:SDR family oxidoreductase n=1 Tax=unclassified Demequina TaxID=2620311 RepID=UPI001CF2195B|nr:MULTISPECIES: SDR family oxidoreductase [unclassified Demequina]MCB2412412.1 SDR family oxidoreductase [Demequina sp. TTPB684]UPU89504.1 SDR family oxidoreductase [Demequina sp. TMPB413]
MSPDQLTFDNPVERHSHIVPHASWQPVPGLDAKLDPKADHGETSYRGTGRLIGRKALITGGDSGIGAAVAIAFAREGADVAINYLPEEQVDADAIAEVVRAEGRQIVLLPGDIRDREFCRTLVADAVEGLGGLDILINNAAHQVYHQSFDDLDEDDLERTIKTNLYAMNWITKDALPHLGPGSTIINSTSVQGYNPSPMIINYASTKFAINGFTKALAQDLAPRGIRVNAVAPGPVWTPLQVSDGQPEEKLNGFGDSSWLGRTSQPVEQAPAYVFLASPESSFVVGEVINVNGGANVP